ncbi:MAG: helix-turn-helix transcriptional regulator [Mogibacterium sp.]|nr:helix-turn-helix transcriptional regulator [Mogibacterium sp.]
MSNNMKELRQAAGLTQAQLAEKSGVNVRMVQYYENGFKDLSKAAFETGLKIAEALGCDPRDLLRK